MLVLVVVTTVVVLQYSINMRTSHHLNTREWGETDTQCSISLGGVVRFAGWSRRSKALKERIDDL